MLYINFLFSVKQITMPKSQFLSKLDGVRKRYLRPYTKIDCHETYTKHGSTCVQHHCAVFRRVLDY